MKTLATCLAYPRIGRARALKWAMEGFWGGKISADQLVGIGRELRAEAWRVQAAAGLDQVPVNDFSWYDHVLDAAVMVDAIPERFAGIDGTTPEGVSALARGSSDGTAGPLEMTKWFDTNYHHLVPELRRGQDFRPVTRKVLSEFQEARELGHSPRPVLVGPVTLLLSSASTTPGWSPLDLMGGLAEVYGHVLAELHAAGAEWIQLDEPCLAGELPDEVVAALITTYRSLCAATPASLLLATYHGGPGRALPALLDLPLGALHIDGVRAMPDIERALVLPRRCRGLSLGLVDGRNVWKTALDHGQAMARRARAALGPDATLFIASSCPLIHCPLDLAEETGLDPALTRRLAFAQQKLAEIASIARAADGQPLQRTTQQDPLPRAQPTAPAPVIDSGNGHRGLGREERAPLQRQRLGLGLLPTTTIGSLPQTAELRSLRRSWISGAIAEEAYRDRIHEQIRQAIRLQEDIGLDVLVHGEFERADMVDYFAAHLEGFALTGQGWVQSYGSRCVKPPIIVGRVARRGPITVDLTVYAQSLTGRPVKGMLTGPVTMLQWSFVREDQPRSRTCMEIAQALRGEVADLDARGVAIIQVDEPALREGLPLRVADQPAYLEWATAAFRHATGSARPSTQIHTHMCYARFDDILEAIAGLDADVVSIETARSRMELLSSFAQSPAAYGIGPGIYDIHAPRVPEVEEMSRLLELAIRAIPADRLWVNPDCGLKTRTWEQVVPALRHMVQAAQEVRQRHHPTGAAASG